jgi:hypothetical protein
MGLQARSADNDDMVEGRWQRRVVDQADGAAPLPDDGELRTARSVQLSSTDLDLVAKADLVEGDHQHVRPVDYKRGSPTDTVDRAWQPKLRARPKRDGDDFVEKINLRVDLGRHHRVTSESMALVRLGDAAQRGESCFEFMGIHPELPPKRAYYRVTTASAPVAALSLVTAGLPHLVKPNWVAARPFPTTARRRPRRRRSALARSASGPHGQPAVAPLRPHGPLRCTVVVDVPTASRPWLHCGVIMSSLPALAPQSPRPLGRAPLRQELVGPRQLRGLRLHGHAAVAPLRRAGAARRQPPPRLVSTARRPWLHCGAWDPNTALAVMVLSPRPAGRGSIAAASSGTSGAGRSAGVSTASRPWLHCGLASYSTRSMSGKGLHGQPAVAPLRLSADVEAEHSPQRSPRPAGRGSIAATSTGGTPPSTSGSPRPAGRGSIAATGTPRTTRSTRSRVSTASRPWLHLRHRRASGWRADLAKSPRPAGRGSIAARTAALSRRPAAAGLHGQPAVAPLRQHHRRGWERAHDHVSTASRPWLHCGTLYGDAQLDSFESPRPAGRGSIAAGRR